MNDALRPRLHDLALDARHLLTAEARSLLTAVYGLDGNGRLEAVAKLPAVQALPEVAETRTRLEQYLGDEAAAGRSAPDAVARLVREVAFTHLNRLVALKLLEGHRLVRGTLDKHHASNGFLFYLADHPEDEARYQAGDLPQDALGEGPRDRAYRHFLIWQTAQLAGEVPVLFDTASLATRLFPRPRALRQLVEALDAPELREAWAAGNEETIGWVYQGFNSEELQQAFRDVRLAGKKFEREDIPAVTQLFTPRWIVRFLVENTLGRHWLRLHPDSRLAAQWSYLVPSEEGQAVAGSPQRAAEITLLDPACGTMHFGLVAFDLFAQMYREELERAGEPGWPATPSVASADAIPAAILTNNLFGIDIDLRAVQLAALCLYVRAKALSPRAMVTPRNLVCADVTVLDGGRLGAFVETLGRRQPQVAAAIRTLWPHLKQAGEFGTLLRLEDDLQSVFAPARRGRQATGMALLPGMEEGDGGQFRAFNNLDAAVRGALNDFARQEAARGGDATTFVAGAEQGLKLLDLLQRRYDVVVTNPPYMSSRKMNARLKAFVADAYPEGKLDLYAAFIRRCLGLCAAEGRAGMLTMHSFMFISSYEGLRQYVRQCAAIETMLHAGPALFDVGNPGTLQTAAYVLRKEPGEPHRQDSVGTYFRLVREPDAEAKQAAFERAVAELRDSGMAAEVASVYRYRQSDFDAIPGAPWVYWVTMRLRQLFVENPQLHRTAQPRVGLQTGENRRFLRYWWEVGSRRIRLSGAHHARAGWPQACWFPYMKGGPFRRWYGNQHYVVNWRDDGRELRSCAPLAVIRNADDYLRIGVTWSDLTSGRFAARLSPGGFIFDVKGSSAFPAADTISLVLALLNSAFAHYALNLLNPTVSFQVGDLARLPFPTAASATLDGLVERAIMLARQDSAESETTYDFVAPPAWPGGGADVAARHAELAAVEHAIDEEVYRLYGIAGEDRRAIEEELDVMSSQMAAEVGDESPAADDGGQVDAEEPEAAEPLTDEALARRWLSYALGVVLGRFAPGVDGAIGRGDFAPEVAAALRALADDDGIALIAPGHPDDLGARLTRALELMHGEEAAHAIIAAAAGKRGLHGYLAGQFYKDHVQQYRKRPVYWLLQSPGRSYSLLLFHERLTRDSLPLILGSRYVGGQINALRSQLGELHGHIAAAPGRERRRAEREHEQAAELLADAEEFARRIRAVLDQPDERGAAAGWQPEIDDGVLLNLAPLHPLIPAWDKEPKQAWQALERGDYDWSRTAIRYWPDRVLAKCRTNRSFAIAHGIE